jgi:hypothetical protein
MMNHDTAWKRMLDLCRRPRLVARAAPDEEASGSQGDCERGRREQGRAKAPRRL